MGKVIFVISMSLDGFITAANVRPEEPMGDGGQRLHEWAMSSEDERNREILAQGVRGIGAVIAGRRTYDASVPWWGAGGPTGPAWLPVFVVSHTAPEDTPEGGVYTFAGGIEAALAGAQAAAGDKDVSVMVRVVKLPPTPVFPSACTANARTAPFAPRSKAALTDPSGVSRAM